MFDQRREGRSEETDFGTQLTCFLLGGAVGAIVALMFAPKSGRELRGDIADVTRKGVDRGRDAATQIGSKAGEYYEVTRGKASDLYQSATNRAGEVADAARDAATRRGEHLNAAIEAGKRAYAEEKRKTENSGGVLGAAPTYYKGDERA